MKFKFDSQSETILMNRNRRRFKQIVQKKSINNFPTSQSVCVCCRFFVSISLCFCCEFPFILFVLRSKRSMNEVGSFELAMENRFPIINASNQQNVLELRKKNRQTFHGHSRESPVFHPNFFHSIFQLAKWLLLNLPKTAFHLSD